MGSLVSGIHKYVCIFFATGFVDEIFLNNMNLIGMYC